MNEDYKAAKERAASKVPSHTLHQINNYIDHRVPPGDFLRYVFENNLFGAFRTADDENLAAMFDIVNYLYNFVPALIRGSAEAVDRYLKGGLPR